MTRRILTASAELALGLAAVAAFLSPPVAGYLLGGVQGAATFAGLLLGLLIAVSYGDRC